MPSTGIGLANPLAIPRRYQNSLYNPNRSSWVLINLSVLSGNFYIVATTHPSRGSSHLRLDPVLYHSDCTWLAVTSKSSALSQQTQGGISANGDNIPTFISTKKYATFRLVDYRQGLVSHRWLFNAGLLSK